jgi:hypothetical protein
MPPIEYGTFKLTQKFVLYDRRVNDVHDLNVDIDSTYHYCFGIFKFNTRHR